MLEGIRREELQAKVYNANVCHMQKLAGMMHHGRVQPADFKPYSMERLKELRGNFIAELGKPVDLLTKG
jgi:hypothetical protein